MAKHIYLFDKQGLEKGAACDLSPIRANTQFIESSFKWEFEKTDLKRFKQLADLLTKEYEHNVEKVSLINVFGKEGRGRFTLVKKVSTYLRYREYFPKGIFSIDMDVSKSFINALNEI